MLPTLIAALLLIMVHLLSNHLRFLNRLPRSRWLSMAGGVSVAYVFIHLLPELARGQVLMEGAEIEPISFLEHHAYLLALSGLVVFYGIERIIKAHRQRFPENTEPHQGVFWLHIATFACYNALIGYLLVHRETPELGSLLWFTIAMALHFLVNDFGLQNDHRALYRHKGRWVLAAAVAAGWILGILTEISELAVSALTALLAGSVILNVLKEELPEERQSRFGAFLVGAMGYAALLLIL
ncbi:hypothetical protein IQ22_03619 [Pseudomonas duriflava]|uniref:ZIP Zinc transporter n=1 Tax=Pseudomonas duriflava TaxID=459528 RepID=A0A562Q442_9PSED|nr:hypothetical protein [Pseudomonas duriflava]TWI50920.1 hypothetical protein IQ22_03619 [Pseudomonas duriflava]